MLGNIVRFLLIAVIFISPLLALDDFANRIERKKKQEQEEQLKRKQKEREKEERAARKAAKEAAEKAATQKRRDDYVASNLRKLQQLREAKEKKAAEQAAEEARRRVLRDLDQQDSPFQYEIGRHANETLALRYGIANDENAWSGRPARSIFLRKLRPAGMIGADGNERDEENVYLVELTRFRDRRALAVIVKGEEFVRTFLPMHERWFDLNSRLEEKLKGNPAFTLKEIAQFNILHSQDPPFQEEHGKKVK